MNRQRKDEQGYAMAVLLVAMAILMVFLGMAIPVWNQQAKREREEELLFRLRQYAHAVVLYQRRIPGGQPPSVDALVEQRFLRKKYLDPMTGKDFALLRVGQASPGMTTTLPGMTVPPAGGQNAPGGAPAPTGPGGREPGRPGTTEGIGAIRGVVSTSRETSLRQWKGRTRYDQWEVTPEDIVPRFGQMPQVQPGQQGPSMGGTSTRPGGSPSPGMGAGQRPRR